MPLFSVIIPTYNRRPFLAKAVNSICNQTYTGWELIIIDDGSDDNTNQLVSGYNDPRIRYIYQPNKGVSKARNEGLKQAVGQYICFLDSDDWWDKDKLAVGHQYIIQNPQYRIFHTQEIWCRAGELLSQKDKHRKPHGSIFPYCLPLCCVSISTVLIHRSVFTHIGVFDESLPACEDYDFWLRVSLQYPVFLIDKPLTLKDGGRPDQLSQRIKGLDKYRIAALVKLMDNELLSGENRDLVTEELSKKINIYAKGCANRGRHQEARDYLALLRTWK